MNAIKHSVAVWAVCLGCVLQLVAAPGPPRIDSVSPPPGQLTSLTSITITFSEPVTGMDIFDFLINGIPMANSFSGSDDVYTFSFAQQPPYGTLTITWDSGHTIFDLDSPAVRFDENHATSTWQYTLVDQTPPGIQFVTPAEGITVRTLTQMEIAFAEPVLGIDAADLLINGVPASGMSILTAGRYRFTFSQPTNGPVQVAWHPSHGITDFASNPFSGGGWTYTLDPDFGLANIRINEFLAANVAGIGDGDTPPETNDWIEIWNYGPTPVNLNGFSLTDDADDPGKWTFPATNIAPGQYLVVFASEKDRKTGPRLHTNFKLNPNGEYLGLFNAELPRVALTEFGPSFPDQRNDRSYGFDTTNGLKYFATPSPGAVNGSSSISGVLDPPHFNVNRGIFETPFTLILSAPDAGAVVHYTVDGTEPVEGATNTFVYSGPLTISNITTLRAAAFRTGMLPSATVTHTYLFIDQVVQQPANPVGFPTNWGTGANIPDVGSTIFSPASTIPGLVPADYAMDLDPLRVDPNNVNSAIDPVKLQRLKDGLGELPTLSIVMKVDDIFGVSGLYQRSAVESGSPAANKKACSVEMILPDGTTAFATTCGIDLHGNASRNPVKNPKHGFKLNFRSDFGPATLNYRLFEDSRVEEYDEVLLRPDFNSSWRHWSDTAGQGLGAFQRTRATRTRDAWMKQAMRDMGGLASHSRFVHVYLNGLYWGTFDFSEDPSDVFAKNQLGGTEADFDVVDQGVIKNGTITTYNTMRNLPAATTLAQYEQYHQYLNVPEFADYMLLHFFIGHQDWATSGNDTKNWAAIRKRVAGPEGTFRYLPWDGECILLNEDVNRTTVSGANYPTGLHGDLDDSPEYRLLFADRVHRSMIAPNGGLTVATNIARWKKWQAVMDKPIVAESTRWGDYRRDVHQSSEGVYQLYTRENHWLAENTRMLTYFSNRSDIVLGQLRSVNLYPSVSAPVFNRQGGLAARGFNLTMAASNTIHYTLDGSDPRVYGTGAVSPAAATYSGPITLSNSVIVKARALFGTNWSALNEATFAVDALNFPIRITELMYNPVGGDAYEFIEIQNVGTIAVNVGNFSLSGVTYVFPPNAILAPGQIIVLGSDASPGNWSTRYPGVTAFGRFSGSLANGGEKIAIHDPAGNIVHSVDYDDENGWPTLADGSGYSLQLVSTLADPDATANWIASSATDGTPGTHPSPPPAGTITINEVMAENLSAVPNGSTFPDWIEIRNSGGSPVNLAGWSLSDDGNPRKFVFPSVNIPGNSYLVVWCDSTTNTTPGLHTGFALGRNGESVFLYNASTTRVDSVTFGLQLPNYSVGRVAGVWRLTTPTPNAANTAAPLAPSSNLVINEWLANASPGGSDWVELYNSAGQPVALEGLYLGDGAAVFRISSLSFVAAGGFVQLLADELSGPEHLDFKLSASGGSIVFYDESGAERDRVTYVSQAQGVSQGRLPNGSPTIVSFPATQSPGASNYLITYTGPRLNELLAINETVTTNNLGRTPDWIELRNTNATPFDLSGMRLTTDLDDPAQWVFPTNTTIAANGYLVVWFDDGQPASTTAGPVLNTGHSIDGESGEVHLLNSGGQTVDSVIFGFQVPDLSIGVNGSGWTLLANPTPGSVNAGAAALGSAAALRLNEWMADPASGNDWFEIYNSSDLAVALAGVFVTDNLSIAGATESGFSTLSYIGARGFVRVIADSDPSDGRNHATFSLDALGEALRIFSPALGAIDTIYFGDQESGVSEGRLPDGSGTIVRFTTTATPAENNYLPLPNAVINELLAHTDNPLEDAVEIFNPTTTAANIGGWYLSDSVRNLKKYRVPNGTSLPALGFKVFYQNDLTSGPGVPFTFDSVRGDSVYLSAADAGGNLTGYRSATAFGASANGVSFGRYLTTRGVDFTALEGRTFGVDNPANVTEFRGGAGTSNAAPLIGPIVINEIMFHPPDMGTNDNTLAEFIELHNITTNAVPLHDPLRPTNTWRLRGGADFEFPPGVTISSRGFVLVVSFNPVTNTVALNDFRAAYGIPPSVPIFGPWDGRLDNGGEEVQLSRPDNPQTSGPDAGFVPYILVDRVEYDDASPWPLTADGGGASLQRRRSYDYGNDPVNWKGEGPTPARPNVVGSTYVDADADGMSDSWETANGLSASNRADADSDSDGDGDSNLEEYQAGTNPQSSASFLAVPVVTAHPEGATGIVGFDTTFSVSATGTAPLSYKWRFNGRDVPGATDSTFVLSNVQLSDAGQYEAVVMNARGYAISRPAILTVNVPPRFTQQPQSRVITNNNNVTFTVAAVGTGPVSYQWQFYGTNIPGATGPSYTVVNAQLHHSGPYRAVVTDSIASIFSNPANLEVRMAPVFVIQPVSTQNVVVGSSVSFSVRVQGSVPMGYRWRRNGIPIAGAVFESNDTNNTFTIENVQTNQAGTYTCVVTNAAAPSGRLSGNSVLNVFALPVITQQPVSQSAYLDETVSFSVRAAGAGLTYQWLFNGDDIPGATSTNLVVPNLEADDFGDYSVVVTNLAGSVTSAAAALTLPPDLRLRITQSGGALLSFDALTNRTYTIEYRNSLGTNSWQTLQTIPAGATRPVNVPDASATNRFYRLRTPGG